MSGESKTFDVDFWTPTIGMHGDNEKATERAMRDQQIKTDIRKIKDADLVFCTLAVDAKKRTRIANKYLMTHEVVQKRDTDEVINGWVIWKEFDALKSEPGVTELLFSNPSNPKQMLSR